MRGEGGKQSLLRCEERGSIKFHLTKEEHRRAFGCAVVWGQRGNNLLMIMGE